MVWTGLSCLNGFINSVVWNGNVVNWAPVWCDISSKFFIGSTTGIPAASLCITHHLYLISHAGHATFTERQKRNQLIFDLGVGIGLPILQMILHYVVQGHRFIIFEDIGCYPFSSLITVSLPIGFGMSSLIGLVSITYSFLVIRTLRRSRRRFNDLVHHSADSNVNSNHYVRLMLLAAVDIVWQLTVNLYFIVSNIRDGVISPWISWAHVHQGFSYVYLIPVTYWRSLSDGGAGYDSARWIFVTCAFSFFGFFGFSKECMDQYCSVFLWLRTKAGFPPSSPAACAVTTPLPQMKFKTVQSAGSDGLHSGAHQTSIVTLPEPALVRGELGVDFDVRSSVGQQNHATIFTPEAAPSGVLHPSAVNALSNV